MKFKIGDYIYTNDKNWGICYVYTTNSKNYIIGCITAIIKPIYIDVERYRIKWLNTIEEFEITREQVSIIDEDFKKVSYAKMLALLM